MLLQIEQLIQQHLIMDSTKSSAEKVGFWLTIICGIHCILTPLAITFLPVLGSKFAELHQYENTILIVSLFLASILLFKDFRLHKNELPLMLLGASIGIKCIQVLFFKHNFETIFSVSISIMIILGYWLNWKHKAKCRCHTAH